MYRIKNSPNFRKIAHNDRRFRSFRTRLMKNKIDYNYHWCIKSTNPSNVLKTTILVIPRMAKISWIFHWIYWTKAQFPIIFTKRWFSVTAHKVYENNCSLFREISLNVFNVQMLKTTWFTDNVNFDYCEHHLGKILGWNLMKLTLNVVNVQMLKTT